MNTSTASGERRARPVRLAAAVAAALLLGACGGSAATTTQTTLAPPASPSCLLYTSSEELLPCLEDYRIQLDTFAGGDAGDDDWERRAGEALDRFRTDVATRNLDDVTLARRVDELMRLRPWELGAGRFSDELAQVTVQGRHANAAAMRAVVRALRAIG